LKLIPSEWFFIQAYEKAISKFIKNKSLSERAKQWKKLNSSKEIQMANHSELQNRLREKLKDDFFKHLNYFFMVDIYPNNTDKITVSFDKLDL